MNTPEDLRKHMLKHAKTFIDDYVGAALGTAELKGSGVARAAVWDLLSDIIKQAGDPIPRRIDGKDTQARVDDVLGKVAAGKLTPEQGRRYIELITAGFDITELPTLIERLEESEDLL